MNLWLSCFSFLVCTFIGFSQEVLLDDSFKEKYSTSNFEGEYIIHDLSQRLTMATSGSFTSKYSIDATIFPYISLIALESGSVRSDDTECIKMLKPDGVSSDVFQEKQSNYFFFLMQTIGVEKLNTWLSKINFGQLEKETFNGFPYLNNCLKISLEDQLLVLKSLYFLNLPFSYQSMIDVKNNFQTKKFGEKEVRWMEVTTNGKTWIIGWFTVKKYTYLFVQHTKKLDPKLISTKTPFQILGDLFYRIGYIESGECSQFGF